MKKNIKSLYIVISLIAIYIITFVLFLHKSVIASRYGLVVLWLAASILCLLVFKRPKDNGYLKGAGVRAVVLVLLTTVLIIFGLGLFTGFSKSYLSLKISDIRVNLLPVILIIILRENVRFIIAKNEFENHKPIIIFTIMSILLTIIWEANFANFSTGKNIFVFISMVVCGTIAKEAICSYIAINSGLLPNIIYRIAMDSYMYLLPIIPNLGDYLFSVIQIFIPFNIYVLLRRFVNYSDKKVLNKQLKNIGFAMIAIPVVIFLTIIVILVSGVFRYKMIAIASNSMAPVFSRGDAIIYEKIDYEDIQVGEVIVFVRNGKLISHRVASIERRNNTKVFITKGDANNSNDSDYVTQDNYVGRSNFVVKIIGYPTIWINELFE